MKRDFSYYVLWTIYIMLLAVLLPHTAWFFSRAEPSGIENIAIAWLAAIVFEASIAVATHKLSRHIEATKSYRSRWKLIQARYFNAFGAGLLIALVVSTFANLSHAVEFAQPMRVFVIWNLPPITYYVAVGAILPFCSALFAWMLADSSAFEPAPEQKDESLELKRTIRKLEAELTELGQASVLFKGEAKDRILAARLMWPEATQQTISVIADASKSYVSEVLNGTTK